ncbi:hypothetical protein F3Y22_tig00110602pilonHSYRG00259 [Hibiscus syriacus]|uniref:Uncharacterized protein n=1 Tax=Hibiscus syriacus TaxID=106335 RepID=A0A6A3A1H8_HIBSY|nr:hypothetical protein F3Y22_tig00110602pilonHSYRG00259 [Hibiscus syriacus]
MTKSSPDDTSSDLLQDTVSSEMQAQRPENLMHDSQVTGDSSCNSHMTSDAEDNAVEETTVEDGTNEQDLSFSLLDEVLNKHDDLCVESNDQKSSFPGSGMLLSDSLFISPQTFYLKQNGIYSDTDAKMLLQQYQSEIGAPKWFGGHIDNKESVQMQTSFQPSRAQTQLYDQEVERSSHCNNQILKSFGTGAGIRIRSRGPQQRPNLDNTVNQGTTPRRIRLQKELSCGPVKVSAGYVDSKTRSPSPRKEVQFALTEVTEAEATGRTSSSDDESEKE